MPFALIEETDWEPWEGDTPHNFIKRWRCPVCDIEASVVKRSTWHHESVGRTDERTAMQYLIDHGCTHVTSNPDEKKRVDVNVFSEGSYGSNRKGGGRGGRGGKPASSAKSGGARASGGKGR
jgi:uncharacterized membrane protein YgcG